MTLYKYLSPRRIEDLENCTVRFTPPESFDDPFEGRPSQLGRLHKDETIRELLEQLPENLRERLIDTFYQSLKTQFALGRISTDWSLEMVRENFVEACQQDLERRSGARKEMRLMFSCLIGVLSLSEDPSHPLMWSHYADGYSGFVIGVDQNHPCFSEEKLGGSGGLIKRLVVEWECGIHKVRYSRKRPHFGGKKFWEFGFHITKSKHWKYEKEWRVMAPLSHGEHVGCDEHNLPIVLFPLAPEAIECVIFGFRMRKDDAARLLDVIARNDHYAHVELYTAQIDAKKFAINLNKLDRTKVEDVRNLIPFFDE